MFCSSSFNRFFFISVPSLLLWCLRFYENKNLVCGFLHGCLGIMRASGSGFHGHSSPHQLFSVPLGTGAELQWPALSRRTADLSLLVWVGAPSAAVQYCTALEDTFHWVHCLAKGETADTVFIQKQNLEACVLLKLKSVACEYNVMSCLLLYNKHFRYFLLPVGLITKKAFRMT